MVTVEEHEPAARFNDDMLVSKSMELFKPAQLQRDNPDYSQWRRSFSDLPRLAGALGRHESVLDAFRNYELALAPFNVKVKALLEDERRSQTLELANDVTVNIGYESHELRLQRFIDVYERLVVPLNLKKGVVINIDSTVNAIEKAVEEAEKMANVKIQSVFAGIAGSHIKSLNSHGIVAIRASEVEPDDVERVIDAATSKSKTLFSSNWHQATRCLLQMKRNWE